MTSEKLSEKVEKRYGCHNHPPRKDHYLTSYGVKVVDRMSRECMYDRSSTDPQCAGCKHDQNQPRPS